VKNKQASLIVFVLLVGVVVAGCSSQEGGSAGEAIRLNNVGAEHLANGRPEEALQSFEDALPIMREMGDRAGEAMTLSNMALLLAQMERVPEAIEHLEQAINLMSQTGLAHDATGVTIAQHEETLVILQASEMPSSPD
jgi:tetratricopeptide (TPR) repeat protein